MTQWTNATTNTTSWDSTQRISVVGTIYDSELLYDNEYTFDGDYDPSQTLWNQSSQIETAWRD